MLARLIHWWSHIRGNYHGRVATWIEDDLICVGFECDVCGEIDLKTIDKVPAKEVIGNFDPANMTEEK